MKIVEVDTQTGYDQWSKTYDSNGNPLVAIETLAFGQMLGSVKGLSAIDLGCGTGRNTFYLHDLGATVTGFDLSEGMLAKAKEKAGGRNIPFHQGDISDPLPFESGSFDLVVSSLVIEHVQFLTPLFREMGRICKNEGTLLISDLHPAMKLKDAQAQFTDNTSGTDVRPQGFPHSMSEYMIAIRDSSLKLVDVQEFSGSETLVDQFPKVQKFVNWPMLVVFKLRP